MVQPAGRQPTHRERRGYKWWFDEHDSLFIAGTLVHHAEYMLMLEDIADNTSDPNTPRDQLGELTLMDDLDLEDFQTRWHPAATPLYAQGNDPANGTGIDPSPYWRRVLGSGTPGVGGVQGNMTDPDIGYEIGYDAGADCNYVNMYVSWAALGNPSSMCVVWATDIHVPNLDQAPNCDRPESPQGCDISAPTPELDFGDAPDPSYPTLLASNGARHKIDNIWMGVTIDSEADGQPVDQDDVVGIDDEDGVVFLGDGAPAGGPYSLPYIAGQNGAVRITVGGGPISAQVPAYLHGWIDWNQDGDWVDPGEDIFGGSHMITSTGTHDIDFIVPAAGTLSGSPWARFRLDYGNLHSQVGEAISGEVEDHTGFNVSAPDPQISITKQAQLINDVNNNQLPDPGDTVRYTVSYNNPGQNPLTLVYISDDYDETLLSSVTNITDDAIFTSHTHNSNDSIRWPSGAGTVTLNPSDSGSLTYDATLNSVFPAGSTAVQNTVTIYSNETDPLSDCGCFFVLAAPVLTIDKQWTDLNGGAVRPGDIIEYSIDYANNGNADASDVILTDDYSEHCASISNVITDANFTSYTDDGNTITWPNIGGIILAAGDSGTVGYRCTLTTNFPTGTTPVDNFSIIFSTETGQVGDDERLFVRRGGGRIRGGPVGGTVFPVDKIALLAPWISTAGGSAALAMLLLKRRRSKK